MRFLLLLVGLLVAIYLAVGALAATVLSAPRRVGGETTPAAYGFAYEEAIFPARGGDATLHGWLLPHAGATRAVVVAHGKDNSGVGLLNNGYGPLFSALGERGFAVLLLDMRGHGRSGEGRFSFGLNERRDVLGAVDWLRTRGFTPGSIGVYGISMGAASGILATAEEPAIGALVEDCGYAAILPIVEKEWTTTSGLPQIFLPVTRLMGRILYGYDFGTARPVDTIRAIAPRPVLMIHGTADQLIPVSEVDALHAAYPAAEIWKVADATHSNSFNTAPGEYTRRIVAFFDQSLK